MNSVEYENYLRSEVWQQKKHQRMAIDNYTCQACGCRGTSRNPLEVHHLTYTRIGGSEDIYTDLVTVCRSCHTTIHSLMNRITGFYSDGSPRHGWKDSRIGKYMQHVYEDADGIGMIKTQQNDDEMWTE